MADYIHERDDWPNFHWDWAEVANSLAAVRNLQGSLLGRMESVGFAVRQDALLNTLTEDVQKTSEIEGEYLDREQVRSSIARRLGMDIGALTHADRQVEGIVELMLDATGRYDAPLTDERLFHWHAALFPTGQSGLIPIQVGGWRHDSGGPMRVVSGPMGRERVHFEAPEAGRVAGEMAAFVEWFETDDPGDLVLKASLVHLWFVTIHPFDDGNGRIARALSDMMLARSENASQRFYSMSAQIQKERQAYYAILEKTQKSDMDVTSWILWFLACLHRSIEGAQIILESVYNKTRFWDSIREVAINNRQQLMINKLLDRFEGKLTTAKWAKITKCSHDTALRDIQSLVERGVLLKEEAGGRSTSYVLRPI